MRIVYLTGSLPYGKGETFIMAEIEELQRQGHDVLLVSTYPRGEVLHERAKQLLAVCRTQPLLSWEIVRKALVMSLARPRNTVRAIFLIGKSRSLRILCRNAVVIPKGLWLAAVAAEWRADHIHAHWATAPATTALIAGEVSGIPWSFTAHRWDITENNLLRVKAQHAVFGRAISQRGALELESHVAIEGWKPLVIHMGVALDKGCSTRAASQENSKGLRLLVAAQLKEVKGHTYLIEAINLLRNSDQSIKLDIAGEGRLGPQLELMVKQCSLDAEVKFLGVVPHESLLSQLRAGVWSLMVLPSVEDSIGAQEGIPVSLMEAMSAGVPVVSTDTGGIPELLRDGAGVIVPPKDAPALAAAIAQLAENSELRNKLGEAGRIRVQESFDVTRVVGTLVALFARGHKGASD